MSKSEIIAHQVAGRKKTPEMGKNSETKLNHGANHSQRRNRTRAASPSE